MVYYGTVTLYECPNCHNLCRYIQSSNFNDEKEWRCRDCNVKKSFRIGSFFESSHLTFYQIIDFLYFWSRKLLVKDISEEVNVATHMAVEWANIIRDICGLWCIDQQQQIGGEGKVVEIDESKWMHRKYHRGKWKERIWVFGIISFQLISYLLLLLLLLLLGGVERGSNRCFMVPCVNKDRSARALLPLIQEHIAPHTTIVSDAWRSYRDLPNITNANYSHDWVVHEYHFVDPRDPAIHTQTVEGMWGHAKDRFRAMHGTSDGLFDTHLQEFMWRRSHDKDAFANIVFWIWHNFPK